MGSLLKTTGQLIALGLGGVLAVLGLRAVWAVTGSISGIGHEGDDSITAFGQLSGLCHAPLERAGTGAFSAAAFLVLGLAIEGEARLDAALIWTEQPLVKFAEWGLVVLFSLHLLLGLRVLVLEWGPWIGSLRAGWVGAAWCCLFLPVAFSLWE